MKKFYEFKRERAIKYSTQKRMQKKLRLEESCWWERSLKGTQRKIILLLHREVTAKVCLYPPV